MTARSGGNDPADLDSWAARVLRVDFDPDRRGGIGVGRAAEDEAVALHM